MVISNSKCIKALEPALVVTSKKKKNHHSHPLKRGNKPKYPNKFKTSRQYYLKDDFKAITLWGENLFIELHHNLKRRLQCPYGFIWYCRLTAVFKQCFLKVSDK